MPCTVSLPVICLLKTSAIPGLHQLYRFFAAYHNSDGCSIGILLLLLLFLPLPDSDEYILSMKANKHPYRRVSPYICPEINAQQFCVSCCNTSCNSGLPPEEFLKVVFGVS